jgi:hypothetical protein
VRADFEYAAEVLSEAVTRTSDPEARFEFALQTRAAIRTAIRAGAPPRDHYRYQWLVASTRRVLASLSEMGFEFDEKFPQDTSTVLDFLDVIETARLNLIRQCREMGLEPETAEKAEEQQADEVDGEPDPEQGGEQK